MAILSIILWSLLALILLLVLSLTYLWFGVFKKYFNAQVKLETSRIGSLNTLENSSSFNKGKTCVVMGGSVGGLLTSLVLSFHYEKVILVEQKKYEEGKSTAPHGQQTHVFLYRALTILKKLFGGALGVDFIQEILGIGAYEMTLIYSDFAQVDGETDHLHGQFEQVPQLVLPNYQMTRGMFEIWVRDKLLQISSGKLSQNMLGKIEIMEEQRVVGLIFEKSQHHPLDSQTLIHRVVGVKLENGQEVRGDLIVDCTGLTTQTPRYVEDEFKTNLIKFEMPKSKILLTNTYTSVLYKLKDPNDKEGFYKKKDGKTPVWFHLGSIGAPSKIGIIFYRVSQDMGMFILGEVGKNPSCTSIKSPQDCVEYLEQRCPELAKKAQYFFDKCDTENGVVRDWMNYKKDGTVFNHWEEVNNHKDETGKRHVLENFIALGDSVGSLNPVYGQGITCICESELILDEILRRPHKNAQSPWTAETCQEFQERVKNIYMPAYFLATTVDLQHEEAKGGSWWYRNIYLKYFAPDLKQLALASKVDPYVRITFNNVNHMMEGYLYKMLDRKYRARCKNPVNHW